MDEDKKYSSDKSKAYYPHQENWDQLPEVPPQAEEPQDPQEEKDFLEYLAETFPPEEELAKEEPTDNREIEETAVVVSHESEAQREAAFQEGLYGEVHHYEPKKKKASWGKRLAITFGSLVAIALIAFSSIGIYSVFFVPDTTPAVSQEKTAEDQTVEATTSTGDGLSIAAINEKVAPSVVGITGVSNQGSGTGTGIIMSEDGYIMTNAHVVNGFSDLQVQLKDETTYSATVVGLDAQTDLAVIKVEATGLTPAEFGTSAALKVGESVVAIGNPLGLDYAGSVTDGIISALDREVNISGTMMHYIQTNAAINSGNSGGPLVNSEGQVIGINSAKIDSAVAEGMGFAIPVDTALPVVNELMENGYVSGRPQIGISGEDIDEQSAAYNRVPTGVYVTGVEDGSAAAKAGIQTGSLIVAIDGVEIASVAELNAEKNKHAPGDTVELSVYNIQTGETSAVKVKLTEYVPTTVH